VKNVTILYDKIMEARKSNKTSSTLSKASSSFFPIKTTELSVKKIHTNKQTQTNKTHKHTISLSLFY